MKQSPTFGAKNVGKLRKKQRKIPQSIYDQKCFDKRILFDLSSERLCSKGRGCPDCNQLLFFSFQQSTTLNIKVGCDSLASFSFFRCLRQRILSQPLQSFVGHNKNKLRSIFKFLNLNLDFIVFCHRCRSSSRRPDSIIVEK